MLQSSIWLVSKLLFSGKCLFSILYRLAADKQFFFEGSFASIKNGDGYTVYFYKFAYAQDYVDWSLNLINQALQYF
jgi:hypothetical protein